MDLESTTRPVVIAAEAPEAAGPRESRWSLRALVAAPFMPATTARRMLHCSLFDAWSVHAASVLFIVVTIFGFIAWDDVRRFDVIAILAEMTDDAKDFLRYARREPIFWTLATVGVAILIELGFMLLAFGFTPWGARDESFRASYKHSLRQTWLRTSHVWLIVALTWLCDMVGQELRTRWIAEHPSALTMPSAPVFPSIAPDDPKYPQALADFTAATAEYQRQWKAIQSYLFDYRSLQPWYVRNYEPTLAALIFVMAAWFVWAYLRAVGIDRPVIPISRPPLCERCGYNLTAMSLNARCPECGMPITESLGDHVRTGTPWMHRRTLGFAKAWNRTFGFAIRRPGQLGAGVSLTGSTNDHRSFIAAHLPLIFLIGAITPLGMEIAADGRHEFLRDPVVFLLIGTVTGSACVIGTIGCILAVALLVGLYYSHRVKRNMLPASIQGAGYGVGFLVIWACIGGGLIPSVIWLEQIYMFRGITERTGLSGDFAMFMTWLAPNLVCLFFYLRLVVRATAAARYANR